MILTLPVLTQTGVAVYGMDDDVTRELVPEKVLHDPEFLASFSGKPIKRGDQNTIQKSIMDAVPIGRTLGPAAVDEFGGLSIAVHLDESPSEVDPVICIGYESENDGTPGIHPEFGAYSATQTSRKVVGFVGLLPRVEKLAKMVRKQ